MWAVAVSITKGGEAYTVERLLQTPTGSKATIFALSLVRGREYSRLRELAGGTCINSPLLACPQRAKQVVNAVLEYWQKECSEADLIIFVAHGSKSPQAQKDYKNLSIAAQEQDKRCILSFINGTPGITESLICCKERNVQRVVIIPFVVTTGQMVHSTLMSNSEQSWKSLFEKQGYSCVIIAHGLVDIPAVNEIWLQQLMSL